MDEVAQSYNGRVKVGKMDVDKNASTPQRYGVRGIPTLLMFKDGQVQEQIVGYVSRDVIEKALEKACNLECSFNRRGYVRAFFFANGVQYFRRTPMTRPCTCTVAAGTTMGCIAALEGCRRILLPSM